MNHRDTLQLLVWSLPQTFQERKEDIQSMTENRENIKFAENDWKAILEIKITIEIRNSVSRLNTQQDTRVCWRGMHRPLQRGSERWTNQRKELMCPWGVWASAATLETVWMEGSQKVKRGVPTWPSSWTSRHSLRRNEGINLHKNFH